MTIFEEFHYWIMSMLEDGSIPYEIGHTYFIIDFSSKICILSFAGSEYKQNPLLNYEFYPLEAYFFNSQKFINIKDVYIAKITLKELIEQALEKSDFKAKFKNKKIYICEKFKKIDYVF